ncbi:MAG: DUF4214 domain-containing protein [Actinomycetota bacterium]
MLAAAAAVVSFVLVVALGGGPPAAGIDAPVRPEEGEVERLYRSALGRDPDADGYDYWVARRVEGIPLAVVAESFLAGREYQRRFGADDDAEFVDDVYRNVLGRPGDPDGEAYWRGELARGLDRHHLVLLFSESTEMRRRTGTELVELPSFSPVVGDVSAEDVAASWRSGCPVGPEQLRALTLDHVGADGGHARGVLVVHEDVVDEVVAIFAELYTARFPIASMRPVDEFVGDDGRASDDRSMEANNTSGFNCRAITGGTRFSRHAWGLAIDLNPVENPYVSGSTVLPPAGVSHVDRSIYHPAMIRQGDVVTRAFAAAGWTWGGDFRTLADYQHFQR